jgi:hypothetical protein
MVEWYVLFPLMILLHVIEDFHMQGIMARMKQREFWREYPEMYAHDWIPVILLHGMEWATVVALPCILASWFDVSAWFVLTVVVMGVVHAYVDHLKANRLSINLIQDQAVHIVQIAVMLVVYMVS